MLSSGHIWHIVKYISWKLTKDPKYHLICIDQSITDALLSKDLDGYAKSSMARVFSEHGMFRADRRSEVKASCSDDAIYLELGEDREN